MSYAPDVILAKYEGWAIGHDFMQIHEDPNDYPIVIWDTVNDPHCLEPIIVKESMEWEHEPVSSFGYTTYAVEEEWSRYPFEVLKKYVENRGI